MRLAAALVAATLLLAGCGTPPPGEAQIDVDTPELREIKRAVDIEDCAPVDGDPVEGGMPDLTLPCFGGGPDVEVSGLRGPMVVNLWAAWCGPCREEMPVIQEFYEKHGDRVPVIGIDYQDAQTLGAMELAKDSGVTYPLLADPQGDLEGQGPFKTGIGLPRFVFIDESGRARVVAGLIEDVGELEALVEENLGISL